MPTALAATRTIEWLPALSAVAYVAVVIAKFPAMVRALYWDSDAAGAFVLGTFLRGHGPVEIPRFGWWTSMWWLLATRGLPGHTQLWEATGYAFALVAVLLVGWATSRVAGRWAGVAAAATAVAVGPGALTSLLTINFHTSTPFTAAVLGAYLVVLTRSRSLALAVAVGVVAGLNAASDPLLWIAGIAPFALGAAVLFLATRRRDVAGRAAALLATTGVAAFVTDRVMSGLGYHVIPVGLGITNAPVTDFVGLGKSIALVFGANHFFPGVYPSAPLRYAITLFAFTALAATVFVAVRLVLRRAGAGVRAYACFWATAAVLLPLSAWATSGSTGAGTFGDLNYLLTLSSAVGVGIALLASRSSAGRILVSLAIAAVAAVNMAGVARGHAEQRSGAAVSGSQIIRLLESKRLTHGYASYWEAQSLTWKSGTRLLIAPVDLCGPHRLQLCRMRFFTIGSWFEGRPGPSFLILDKDDPMAKRPLGHPSESLRVGADTVVLVYPYDLAPRIHEER